MSTEKNAAQHAADAAVSHGDALAYHAEGNTDDATYSARECRDRVQACHEAAAREGTPEAREAALRAAGLLMTLPGRERLAQYVALMRSALDHELLDAPYLRETFGEIARIVGA
jgi:hypothetical protein